jgi:rubrerythrin
MDQAQRAMMDGLKQAMQAERYGQAFYQMAAASTADPTGQQVFEQLGREEQQHFEFLATHYRALLQTGAPATGAKLDPDGALSGTSPIFSESLRARIKDAHFEMSALAIAVQLELNAIHHYRQQAEQATVVELKRFYQQLADWESTHYHALLAQQQSLQESYWHANGFERV